MPKHPKTMLLHLAAMHQNADPWTALHPGCSEPNERHLPQKGDSSPVGKVVPQSKSFPFDLPPHRSSMCCPPPIMGFWTLCSSTDVLQPSGSPGQQMGASVAITATSLAKQGPGCAPESEKDSEPVELLLSPKSRNTKNTMDKIGGRFG